MEVKVLMSPGCISRYQCIITLFPFTQMVGKLSWDFLVLVYVETTFEPSINLSIFFFLSKDGFDIIGKGKSFNKARERWGTIYSWCNLGADDQVRHHQRFLRSHPIHKFNSSRQAWLDIVRTINKDKALYGIKLTPMELDPLLAEPIAISEDMAGYQV